MNTTTVDQNSSVFYTDASRNANSTDISSISVRSLKTFFIAMEGLCLSVGLPVNCLAIFGLCRLVTVNHVAPVYVINLLISDLLQMPIKFQHIITFVTESTSPNASVNGSMNSSQYICSRAFHIGVSAGNGFMVCIALERYLVIAHPLWYRFRHSVKNSVLLSLAIWTMCVPCVLLFTSYVVLYGFLIVLMLLSSALLVFFYVGTRRAIVAAISMTAAEKARILCMLAFVLIANAVLSVPLLVYLLLAVTDVDVQYEKAIAFQAFAYILFILTSTNLLLDPVLYIFLRTDVQQTLNPVPGLRRLNCAFNCRRKAMAGQGERDKELSFLPLSASKLPREPFCPEQIEQIGDG